MLAESAVQIAANIVQTAVQALPLARIGVLVLA